MALNNADKDSLYVKISVNDKFLSEHKNSVFYLIAQSAGKVYFTSAAHLSGPVLTTLIPKSRFPTGILQFTLLSATGEPLNERVVFIQQNDNLKLSISSAARQYTTRQNVKIDIQAKSATDEAAPGNFSVSVINENYVPVDENAESTILSNLLLTSDLKGCVEKPNYYFIKENEQTRSDLDLLMLTQGYRKFEWKQVLSNHSATLAYQPEQLLELKGSLKTNKGKFQRTLVIGIANGAKTNFISPFERYLFERITTFSFLITTQIYNILVYLFCVIKHNQNINYFFSFMQMQIFCCVQFFDN